VSRLKLKQNAKEEGLRECGWICSGRRIYIDPGAENLPYRECEEVGIEAYRALWQYLRLEAEVGIRVGAGYGQTKLIKDA
jgi:hypothetical protein